MGTVAKRPMTVSRCKSGGMWRDLLMVTIFLALQDPICGPIYLCAVCPVLKWGKSKEGMWGEGGRAHAAKNVGFAGSFPPSH